LDDVAGWKALLHWIVVRELPHEMSWVIGQGNEDQVRQLVRAWILRDRYDIPHFQNLVMLELLKSQEQLSTNLAPNVSIMKEAFEGSPLESPLGRLMMEELVEQLRKGDVGGQELDSFDNVAGFSSMLFDYLTNKVDDDGEYEFWPRLPGFDNNPGSSPYQEFMVGGKFDRHWVVDGLVKSLKTGEEAWE
jgi:hypothetical protein